MVGADEKDQLTDVVDLIYRLRHTENAADMLPSTEYAAIRSALSHNSPEILLRFLNDPVRKFSTLCLTIYCLQNGLWNLWTVNAFYFPENVVFCYFGILCCR